MPPETISQRINRHLYENGGQLPAEIPRAILENRALPDWGEPENPLRHKTWTQRLLMPRKSFLVKIK